MAEITLEKVSRFDPDLVECIKNHYAGQKGLPPGRCLPLKIVVEGKTWGYIAASSCTYVNIGNRNSYFEVSKEKAWQEIVSNSFFHVDRDKDNEYPCRNFVPTILKLWRKRVERYWRMKYGIGIKGFETTIGLNENRSGGSYERDHWVKIGMTKGMSRGCGCGKYSGKGGWRANGNPKLVMVRRIEAK